MPPDFLCIGAQKAGTTWLHRNLGRDPQFWVPHEKELHYFDEKVEAPAHRLHQKLFGSEPRDERWRRQVRRQSRKYRRHGLDRTQLRWDIRYFLGSPDDDWYRSLFAPARGRISGEITPNYSVLEPEMVERVHRMAPDLRVVFFIRNPIERAWSHAMMEIIRVGDRDPETTPDELFIQHFHKPEALRYADYLLTIETWSRFYPEDRIFIGYLEDIHFSPRRLLHRIWEFLGADPADRHPAADRVVHSGGIEHIPTRFATYLAELYGPRIADMAAQLRGFSDSWRHLASQLTEDPPADELIPYPLWESPLWDEWIKERGGVSEEELFASGTLDEVRSEPTVESGG